MDRIKRRIALCLAASALASVGMAAPASAGDSCHPLPQAYCNAIQYLNDCVFWPPPAEYCDN
ncbi:MAG TPA: hypothetical protein VEV43_10155 [Actinomycetota bacterium]|nr:hypothetical protein [Actinomycetota bacterium]